VVRKLYRKSIVFTVIILFCMVGIISTASINLSDYGTHSMEKINYSRPVLFNPLKNPRFLFDYLPKRPANMDCYTDVMYNTGYSTQQTRDEGYILTGFTGELDWDHFPYMSYDVLLIKTDVNGNEEWSKTFEFMNISVGYSVQQTGYNGYIVGGSTSFINNSYALLLKTDSNGNEEWSKTFDGLGLASGTSVQLTKDSGYIITGATQSVTNTNISYVFLLKTDENGNEKWCETFEFKNISCGYYVQQTADEGYIITGVTGDLNSSNYSSRIDYELLLLKTDKYGNEEWSKTFVFEDINIGYSVLETDDSGYIITGNGISHQNFQLSLFLLKTDKYGNEEWSKTYDNMMGYSVLESDDNGYVVGGSTSFSNSYALLLKTDKHGNEEWSKTYDGLDSASGTTASFTIDNGYIMTGITASYANPNFMYALLLKIDENGDEEWCKNLASAIISTELEIEICKSGIIIRNIGEEDAYDVNVDVDITGFIFVGKHVESNVEILQAGEEMIVEISSFMLGFGPIEITATADAYNAEIVSDTKNGFLMLFFLILT